MVAPNPLSVETHLGRSIGQCRLVEADVKSLTCRMCMYERIGEYCVCPSLLVAGTSICCSITITDDMISMDDR